ncbi:uncharacterized protein LOC107839933 [Capsicum annuum]|uniref:uncharacterized protein LOC107839933 n=1 Tax=Capsicum annuum TaxID=4072 RepID=UPI001FB0563C|nr:uncharacterized protein LOC107839933 [Capsicum annuum]
MEERERVLRREKSVLNSLKRYFAPVSSKLPQSSSSIQNTPRVEENLNQVEENHHSAKRQKQRVNLNSLLVDPKERKFIWEYNLNDRDEIRRAYIQRGPHQPRVREFPQRDISGLKCRFNRKWFKIYHDWLEYSEIEDVAYCLCCYLFQDESIHQGGGETFSSIGFKSWNKNKRLDMHVGGPNSDHNKVKKKCEDLMQQEQSIEAAFVKPSNQTKLEYKICLQASVDVDIVTACKLETVKVIMEDLNGDYFSLLVDESCDVSRKEQIAIVLRYVDGGESVVERFIGIVHVHDTSALCLKEAVVNYLTQHSLSLSCIRGQCCDGASNMQGHLSGLKVLIQQESRSAHAIHYFAHQL